MASLFSRHESNKDSVGIGQVIISETGSWSIKLKIHRVGIADRNSGYGRILLGVTRFRIFWESGKEHAREDKGSHWGWRIIYKILDVLYFLFLLRLPEVLFIVLWWGTSLLPKRVRVILTMRGTAIMIIITSKCTIYQNALILLEFQKHKSKSLSYRCYTWPFPTRILNLNIQQYKLNIVSATGITTHSRYEIKSIKFR